MRVSSSVSAPDIVTWLRGRAAAARASGFVFGLSGGVDSAVVARLCQLAMPEGVRGVIMPCHSDPQDEADARLVAEEFQIPIVRVDLGRTFDVLTDEIDRGLARPVPVIHAAATGEPAARLAQANLKPRLRMATLYFLATIHNALVAGTGNRSEIAIGYFTKYGDGGVDLLPIGHLLKRDVRGLARSLGVPEPIIDKPPSAGLWLGQTDEAEMGFSYADLEAYLEEGPDKVPPALALRVERLVRLSEHKRRTPPIPGRSE
jgi:NAD+ synthase